MKRYTLALLSVLGATLLAPDAHASRRVHAIAVYGDRAYLATGDNHAELVVKDLIDGTTLGTFDAPGPADAISVKVVAPGVVKIGRRKSRDPEMYKLDVTDPAHIVMLATGERSQSLRWRQDPLPPVMFPDVNHDGVYRLGCVGDSNTASPTPNVRKWCEMLADAIGEPDFEIVNVAVAGATVTPNLRFDSDATQQMAEVLALEPDAIVLAFGTNDFLQQRSVDEIVDAYVVQSETAAAAGVAFFVGATPPMGGCSGTGCGQIYELNQRLAEVFPGHVADFFSGFIDADYRVPDRIHLNDAGQALRAERALEVLTRAP